MNFINYKKRRSKIYCAVFYCFAKLKSNQLDYCHFSCVSPAGAELCDTRIAAVPVGILRGNLAEQLIYDVFLCYEGHHHTLVVKIVFLCDCDHLLRQGADLLGAGDRSLYFTVL